MQPHLTLQTASAIERIYDSLMGKTSDDFEALTLHLRELLRKADEIAKIYDEVNQ
jgi:hypothetical protein